MKRTMLFALVAVVALSGATCDGPTATYTGSVSVRKANGHIQAVEVIFPSMTTVYTRANATALVDQVESLLIDLKAARDQFPVDEATTQQEVVR